MICPRCAKENDPGDRYCSRCGLEFAKVAKAPAPTDGETMYCYRHPKEATNLFCGKCERPICTRCVINGPAGIRCPECGRSTIKRSARGIAHDASQPLKQTFGYWIRNPWGIVAILFIMSWIVRGFMSCGSRPAPPPDYYFDEEVSPPENSGDSSPEKRV